MRENRPSGLMRGGKQTVIGPRASQSVASRLLYTAGVSAEHGFEDCRAQAHSNLPGSLADRGDHREEKDTLGVGKAQVWNEKAVPRQPVLAVAAYSALLLAAIQVFGHERHEAYAPLPLWRSKRRRRPSCLDLLARLRKEATEKGASLLPPLMKLSSERMVASAAA